MALLRVFRQRQRRVRFLLYYGLCSIGKITRRIRRPTCSYRSWPVISRVKKTNVSVWSKSSQTKGRESHGFLPISKVLWIRGIERQKSGASEACSLETTRE